MKVKELKELLERGIERYPEVAELDIFVAVNNLSIADEYASLPIETDTSVCFEGNHVLIMVSGSAGQERG